MSFSEEQRGIYFMGGKKENYSKLILPQDGLKEEFEKARLEKEAEEARTLLLELERQKEMNQVKFKAREFKNKFDDIKKEINF